MEILNTTHLDDLATMLMIDTTYATWSSRKFNPSWISSWHEPPKGPIKDAISRFAKKNTPQGEVLTTVIQKSGTSAVSGLEGQLRLYLPMYERKCGWEIIPTDQYGVDVNDSAVRARRNFDPGDILQDLQGKMEPLSAEEALNPQLDTHLSLIEKDVPGARPYYLIGPVRFVNHHCTPNARLYACSGDTVVIIIHKHTKIGDEITISYGPDYFGDHSRSCLCPDHRHHPSQNQGQAVPLLTSETLAQEVLERHHEIYGFDFPATFTPVRHSKLLRSGGSIFVHSGTCKLPPRRRRRAPVQDQQTRHNASVSLTSPRPPSGRSKLSSIFCELCQRKVEEDEVQIRSHLQSYHPEMKNFRAEQEFCEKCGWHPRAARKLHFQKHHGGDEPVRRHQAQVFDPRTLKFVARKRKIGPNSKHYRPPSSGDIEHSSDSESGSGPDEVPTPTRDAPDHSLSRSSIVADSPNYLPSAVTSHLRRVRQRIGIRGAQLEGTASGIEFHTSESRSATHRQDHLDLPTGMTAYEEGMVALSHVWKHQNVICQPITATAYKRLVMADQLTKQVQLNSFVTCTSEEARMLLELGAPANYFLISNAAPPVLRRNIVLGTIRATDTVVVTDLDAASSNLQPGLSIWNGRDAVWSYEQPDKHVIMASLSSCRSNPFPTCIADLPPFDILHQLKDTRLVGATRASGTINSTNQSSTQLCASRNAFVPAEMTPSGLIQTTFVEWGSVLVLLWPKLSENELAIWMKASKGTFPATPYFALALDPGDLFIQPSWSVMAMYFAEDTCLTRTLHAHSPSLHSHVHTANLQMEHPHTTPSRLTRELSINFVLAAQQMYRGNNRWPWPQGLDRDSFVKQLKVLVGACERKWCHCWDRADCCAESDICPCQLFAMGCNENCHPDGEAPSGCRTRWRCSDVSGVGSADAGPTGETDKGADDLGCLLSQRT